eukprot:TRINITY_DN5753_c1_g1_i3.p1 TRINITY_DN5753_c1_g1~~TRINITY_DN5753_c1_g1_i3.p1  ORF type:complete len:569 (+),score=255.72 TRINITY_DN5753_c1_g1_i3:101-1807(+)
MSNIDEIVSRYAELAPTLEVREIQQIVMEVLGGRTALTDQDKELVVDKVLQRSIDRADLDSIATPGIPTPQAELVQRHADTTPQQPSAGSPTSTRNPMAHIAQVPAIAATAAATSVLRAISGFNAARQAMVPPTFRTAEAPATGTVEDVVAAQPEANTEVPSTPAEAVAGLPVQEVQEVVEVQQQQQEVEVQEQEEVPVQQAEPCPEVEESAQGTAEVGQQQQQEVPVMSLKEARILLASVSSPMMTGLIVAGVPRVGKTSTINAMLTVPLLPVKYSGLSYTLEAASGLKYTLHATDAEGQDHTTSLELDHLPVFQQKQRMQEALESFADEVRFPGKAVHITGPLKLPKKLLLSERTGPVEVPEDTVVVVLVNDMPEEDILAYKQLNKGTVVFARITPGADKGEKGEGVPAGVDVVDIDPKHFLSVCLVAAFSPDQPGYQGTFDTFKAQVHTAIKLVQERGAQRRHEIAQTVQAAAAAMAQQWRDISHSAGSVMDTLSRPPASSERHVNVVPQDTTPATVPEVPAVPKNMEEPYVPASSSYQPPCTDYVPAASDYTPATSTWQPQPDC